MAETAVATTVDHLFVLLTQEVNLLKGVHSEVESIKRELESIKCFLKHADMKAESEQGDTSTSSGVKAWVKELREAAFQIEDVVDKYIHHLAQGYPDPRHSIKILSLYKKCNSIIKLKRRYHIASEIQVIKEHLLEIKERSTRYGFDAIEQGSSNTANSQQNDSSWYDPRKEALYLQEAEVAGVESSRAELISWLQNKESKRSVISVLGTGGLGKTTLAKNVYNLVNQDFACHASVTVSESYQKEELLKNVIKQFYRGKEEYIPTGIDTMDEDALTNTLREYLHQKRYIVVFHDVWQVDFWGHIKQAFAENQSGGRIVITTRNMEVANFCKTTYSIGQIHEMQLLPPGKAWELFCTKAFHFEVDRGRCPIGLERLSRKIVEKCGGLPLAIVVIAGLLSTKDKRVDEWQKLHDSLSSELESNPHLSSITRILSLSYNDLPWHLKSCFLYLGMYPEDYSIRCSRLIRQWIAEGFVKQKSGKTLETIAQEYLTELIHRSLVQVSTVDLNGKARECHIHDILREVALKKMEDSSFSVVLSGKERTLERGVATRRLSMVNASSDAHKAGGNHPIFQIRSILYFNNDEILLDILTKDFKLLKILDFENGALDIIHEDIGNLFHLKYLSLRDTQVKKLPRSIGKLVNLETLDLKRTFVFKIPSEIRNLHKLRHLLAYNHYDPRTKPFCHARSKGIKLQEGLGGLESLQKLYMLDAKEMGINEIKELGKLRQLRRLGITNLKTEFGRTLCGCIENMNHLQTLEVQATGGDDFVDLEYILSPPQILQRLYLYGRLRKLPEWIRKLQNLAVMRIAWSRLEDVPLRIFENLPNLLELRMTDNAYVGREMKFENGVFPKLKELHFADMSKLRRIVIEEGSLQHLEVLGIASCPEMTEDPSGIQHLKYLQGWNTHNAVSHGFWRLGFIIDFLSEKLNVSLLGITHFTKKMCSIPVLTSAFHTIKKWSWQTILMGFFFLIVLLLLARQLMKLASKTWSTMSNEESLQNLERFRTLYPVQNSVRTLWYPTFERRAKVGKLWIVRLLLCFRLPSP